MSNHISVYSYKSPLGNFLLGSIDNKLCLCDWEYRKMRISIDNRIKSLLGKPFVFENTDTINATIIQLEEYFQNKRVCFDIPLLLLGTDFQRRVWNELLKIEFGSTISYLELANRLNSKLAIRAIASANGANAISILVPCHRIIGSKGDLVGYAGGLSAKRQLIDLESKNHQGHLF